MKGERLIIEKNQSLEQHLSDEANPKIRLKLAFLHCIATLSTNLSELCKSFGISESTGYWWVRNWNTQGYDGLLEEESRSGRPARLDDFDISYLKLLLKEKSCWTLPEIAELIQSTFGVNYSPTQLTRILRNRVNMHFCKPYAHDYRRPKDAEAILKQRLHNVFITLKEKGLSSEQIAIGSIDEASPQNRANTVRFWSLDSHPEIVRNTTHFKSNTIGFYAMQGFSVQGFIENSKEDAILEFFHQIKQANLNYLAIIVVLDNFSSHKSEKVVSAAVEMGIYLIYLPPYSPDLNPTEFIWKSIRRELSKRFITNLEDMKKTITHTWKELSDSLTFAKYWIETFLRNNPYYSDLCIVIV
jgi:transposase